MLKRKFNATCKEFRSSERCSSGLRTCIERITKQPHRLYTILNDLKLLFKREAKSANHKIANESEELVVHKDQSPLDQMFTNENHVHTDETVRSQTSEPVTLDLDSSNKIDDNDSDIIVLTSPDPVDTAERPKSPSPSSPLPSTSYAQNCHRQLPPGNARVKSIMDRKHALVLRLEQLLARIAKSIKDLEERELDLNDLESSESPYVQLDVLKRRYLDVWRRLCEARKVARSSGRILRRRFVYTGCRYPSVNTMVEQLVNEKKRFPDMTDIRRIVAHVNKHEELQLR
ncbi:unnamed protein product [Echinostoma caproni]|uniref:Death domain-containing protein n=1 Tax=Echinostoma caproni TaxID=27848 RepID=A0A183ATE4_9TREM|nr:unnamed protein product [Echinostoma caproni]